MSAPNDRLAAMIAAHRRVRRPPPGLRDQIARSLADTEYESDLDDVRPSPRSRWLESTAISVALAAAALLLIHWFAGPRATQGQATSNPARDEAAFGAAKDDHGDQAQPKRPTAPATPSSVTPPTRPPAPTTDATPRPVAATPTPTSAAPAPAAPSPAAAPRVTEPAAPIDDGTLEIRRLRQAEVALARDPQDALRRLQAHAKQFPNSVLTVERQALLALAACATRATDGPQRRDAFLAAHPGSAYAARVRAACARP
jgi:type IV secretory pathway VirB10-like protein